uniref:Uncharacterized protein n=1 Tax=viral metagenome TaxID=1070528 RepID=A0A6C0HQ92_9ZZZZ
MPKTKTRINKKSKNSRKRKSVKKSPSKLRGGIGEQFGLPPCNILAQFPIQDNFITEFKRAVPKPADCFINALQLAGLIDSLNANIMRVSSAGSTGFSKESIEKIFILIKNHNFDFKSSKNFDVFLKMIRERLIPGHAVFAGYDTNPGAMVQDEEVPDVPVPEIGEPLGVDGIPIPPSPWYWRSSEFAGPAHIFIIARAQDGVIYYIDPQLNLICNIDSCADRIKLNSNYFLLFNSTAQITPDQARMVGILL